MTKKTRAILVNDLVGPEDAVNLSLQFIGEDPSREGLRDTPKRVAKSWEELYSGYELDPIEILNTAFTEGACEELVICRDIEFYSTCEHHMLPFFGKAHVGYLPNGKIVGLSKLARCVDAYARRLQVQERLTSQVADAVMKALGARGCAVVLEGQHFCMMARGVRKQTAFMTTSAIRGEFETDAGLRAEFHRLIGRK